MTPRRKDIFREITGHKLRFLSLVALIAIGVFVLVGLTVTGAIMRDTVATTLEEANAYDVKLAVSSGLEEEDLRLLNDLGGIEAKEYFHTAYLTTDDSQRFFISSLPKRISAPRIVEGRAPEAADEILLDRTFKEDYALGDRISFQREENPFDDEAKPIFHRYDYKVVGFATSIRYLDEMKKGFSPEGDEIDGFGFVSPLAFRDPAITEAHLQFKDLEGLRVYETAYREKSASHKEGLKAIFKDRPEKRLEENLAEMREDIRTGEEEIRDGYRELDEGKQAILDGERELSDGEKALDEARGTYRAGIREGESELSTARDKLARARESILFQEDRLSAGEKAWLDGKNAVAAAMIEMQAGREEALEGIERTEAAAAEILAQKEKLDAARVDLETKQMNFPHLPPLPATKSEIRGARKDLEAIENGLPALREEVEAAKREVEKAEALYREAKERMEEFPFDEDEAKARLAAIESEIAVLEERLKAGESSADETEKNSDEIRAREVEESSKDAIAAEIAVLEEEKARIEKARKDPEFIAAKTALEEALKKRDEAKKHLADRDRALEADEGKRKEILDRIARYEAAVEAREEAIRRLEEENAEQAAAIRERRKELEDALRDLESQAATLEAKRSEVFEAQAKSEAALLEIEKKKGELSIAEAELDRRQEELASGRTQLMLAREQLNDGERSYAEGLSAFEREKEEGKRKLDEAAEELYAGREDLEAAKAEYDAEEADALKRLAEGEEDVARGKDLLTLLSKPSYSITPLNEDEVVNTYLDYSRRIDQLAMVFPVFLFAVALLLASTVMNRMVDERRLMIGTYKSLGYSDSAVASKYVIFGTAAALIGGIPGAIAGNFLLSSAIADAYFGGSIFPGLAMKWYGVNIAISILLGMLATGLIAWIGVRKSLKLKTAQLLVPKPPAKGTRILLERIPVLWRNLSFFNKVTARNLARDKKRILMTVFGVMGCVALLVMGFGIRTSVDGFVEKQNNEINRYDYMLAYEPLLSREDHAAYLERIESDPNIERAVAGHMENVETEMQGDLDQSIVAVAPADVEELKAVVTLRNRKSGREVDLNKGPVITEKLAEIKGIEPGDKLVVKNSEDEEYSVPVEGIVEGYAGHYLYMSAKDYEEIFGEPFKENMHYLVTGKGDISDYRDYDSVLSISDTSSMKRLVDEVAQNINFIVLVILAASSALAVVVLSTLTNINIEERRREISTIRVLGFYPGEVTRYIYRETGALTLVGIVLGFVVGKALHGLVIRLVVPNFAMLDPALNIANYLLPAAMTILISFALMLWFHRKLQAIDMVEALKGVE